MTNETGHPGVRAHADPGGDETLHPDLLPYLVKDGPFGPMLKHPLVFQVPLLDRGLANQAYEQKRVRLANAQARGDWSAVVWLHERPYRTFALIQFAVGLDDAGDPRPLQECDRTVQELAARVWTDSENLGECAEEWEAMLAGAERLVLADAEERAAFEDLPDPLTVYRAAIDDGGWSWTLDPNVARFFANRWDQGDALVAGTVAKADVIGYLTHRNEAEVLIPEGRVRDVRPWDDRNPDA